MKLSSHRLVVIFLSTLILAGSTYGYGIDKTHYRELFQKFGQAAKQKNWQTANVGWSKVDDNTGLLKPGEKFTPPVLLKFRQEAPFHSKQPSR
jgi:hypothetical protein